MCSCSPGPTTPSPLLSYAFPIQRALRITDANRVEMFDPEQLTTRSQDLEPAYHDAGQFYWGRAGAWSAGTPLLSKAAVPVIIPRVSCPGHRHAGGLGARRVDVQALRGVEN